MDAFTGVAAASAALRMIIFAVVMIAAVICLLDWAVRTRRINPFGRLARAIRTTVDPLIAPVERRIVRAGGQPSSAPLWALAAVIVAGIFVVTAVDFLVAQIAGVMLALNEGPRGVFVLLVAWTFGILRIALIVRVLVSWLPVSPYSPWVRWSFVLTEPMLDPLRRVIPTLGAIDITPLIAYFALGILQGFLLRLML